MSSSNAAAIRRRAGINPQPATTASASTSRSSSAAPPINAPDAPKLTLPEVIAIFDKRISQLETTKTVSSQSSFGSSEQVVPSNLNEVLDEFNLRFEVIAEEISTLKDTILKLQSFTMDVNKVLMNERVRVLSDLGTNVQLTTDDADVNSVFSLASEVTNNNNEDGQASPTTSVDMREEITK